MKHKLTTSFENLFLCLVLTMSLLQYDYTNDALPGAGIPDFRTPGTGLYDNLKKYDLPYPEAIFELSYYRRKPGAFVSLAHELWPGIQFQPTLTHHFLKLLAEKGLLLRIYSQNIDGLEFLAGIPDDKLVECHGHFRTASCIDCGAPADIEKVKENIVGEGKTPKCKNCGGNVKPDIVFFGEGLPDRFHRLLKKDIPKADLLLVMGTSLKVAPVSMIPDMVRCNRVLFNRDLVMKIRKGRDMFVPGDCDSNVQKLIDLLGWTIVPKTTSTDDEGQEEEEKNSEEDLEKIFAKIEIKDDDKQN
jgi:NAD-dependent SIR2 family protein deacetylase